jgi:hypothetical protein
MVKHFLLFFDVSFLFHFHVNLKGVASMTSENRSLVNAFKAWWKCLSLTSIDIMSDNKTVSGYHLGYLMNSPDGVKKTICDLQLLMKWYEEKKIHVEIDSFFSFSKVSL